MTDPADSGADASATGDERRLVTADRVWLVIRLAAFALLALVLTIQQRDRLGSMVPGDSGDAFFVMSVLEWGGDRARHFFDGYWDGPMFSAGTDVMAYSDTLLPLVIPFELLLVVTGSRVVSFNVLYLASWVVCGEATYHLALRLVRSRPAAMVAAVTFTFSTIRVTQSNHFQLAWAAFIPLAVLLLFRLWERPTPARGAWLAVVVLIQLLTSAYYGVVLIVFSGVGAGVGLVWTATKERTRTAMLGYATFAVTLLLPLTYIRAKYVSAEESAVPREGYPIGYSLTLGDLRSPSPRTSYLRRIGVLDTDTVVRSSENYAYVGCVALVAIPVMLVLLAVRPRSTGAILQPYREWAALLALGVCAFLVAVGEGPILGIDMPFYGFAADWIPGIGSMVALVRLFVFTQLLLGVAAAAVIAAGFRMLHDRTARCTIAVVLIVIVAAEARMSHSMVTVIEPESGSVFAEMQSQQPGVVAILPMVARSLGPIYAFAEASRMVLGTDDDLQSVNGYSGYAPRGYEESAEILNGFPDPASVRELERLGVRYVVLMSSPVKVGMTAALDAAVNAPGRTFLEPAEIERRLAELPPGLVVARHDASDGVLLELSG